MSESVWEAADAAWAEVSRWVDLWRNPETRDQYSDDGHRQAVERSKAAIISVGELPYLRPAWASGDAYECSSCTHFRARDAASPGFCTFYEGLFKTPYTGLCEEWMAWATPPRPKAPDRRLEIGENISQYADGLTQTHGGPHDSLVVVYHYEVKSYYLLDHGFVLDRWDGYQVHDQKIHRVYEYEVWRRTPKDQRPPSPPGAMVWKHDYDEVVQWRERRKQQRLAEAWGDDEKPATRPTGNGGIWQEVAE